ncbi:MAG: antibiotic biosynthesis monooxygenase family protein [Hyphomicrobiaceae bacterium]|jgi:quinol monooxygenase YgiN
MQPIGIYIEYRPFPEHFETFMRLLRKECEDTMADNGCLRMEIAQPEPPDGRIFLIELWRDEEAIKAHAAKPGHSHAWQDGLVAEKCVDRCRVDYSPSPKW